MQGKAELKRGWILAALMLTLALAAMDATIVATAIPQIVSDLGGFTKISWVFSIYLLAQTVTIPLYGKLADIHGRKKVLIFGIVVFLIGSALSAAAWDMHSLIAFRGLQGLGAGSIMASVNTIAGDIYTVAERARIQGYLSSMWGISAIIGPAIGGALAEYVNWRWIFIINLPIGILSIWFLIKYFDEQVESVKQRIDHKGAILIVLTLSLFFILLLQSGQSWPWLSVHTAVLLTVVVVLAIWTYRVEKGNDDAMLPVWVWKNKTLAFTNLAVAGLGITMMGPDIFLPTFTQASLGLGIIASGFVLASMSIGWPTASALSGRIYMRIGFRETSIIGTGIIFLAVVIFLLLPRPQPIWALVLDTILIGAGFGLLSTPSMVGIQSMVAWGQRGVVTGANVFARNLGQSLGAAIMGAIFNNTFLHHMARAPQSMAAYSGDVLKTLHEPLLDEQTKEFLRSAIDSSMQNVYWSMLIFTVLIFWALYVLPHRDPRDETLLEVPRTDRPAAP